MITIANQKPMPMRFLFVILLPFFLCSCKKLFTYSANEIQIEEKDRNQNIKNIERLQSKIQSDSFSFVVISDPQRFYDEMDDFVEKSKSLSRYFFCRVKWRYDRFWPAIRIPVDQRSFAET